MIVSSIHLPSEDYSMEFHCYLDHCKPLFFLMLHYAWFLSFITGTWSWQICWWSLKLTLLMAKKLSRKYTKKFLFARFNISNLSFLWLELHCVCTWLFILFSYKNDPEILAMTNLIVAYQRNEILEFEKIIKVQSFCKFQYFVCWLILQSVVGFFFIIF